MIRHRILSNNLSRTRLGLALIFFLGFIARGQINNPDSLYLKASEYHAQDDYDNSLKLYLRASYIYDSIGDQPSLIASYNSIGLIYHDVKNYEQSQYYFKKALEGLRNSPDEKILSYVLNNLGMVAENNEYHDTAIFYYSKSLEIKERLGDSAGMSRTHNNIGGIMLQQGKYDEALKSYRKSMAIKYLVNDTFGLATVHANIANIHGWKNNFDSVRYYLNKGIQFIRGKDRPAAFLQFYTNYGALYYALEDFETAYKYADSASRYQARSFNEKLATQMAKHQTVYDLQKKDQKIKDEQSKNIILREKRSRERVEKYILAAIITSLIIVLVLLYIILKNRAKQVKQNKLLFEREKQLNAVILEKNKQQEIILKNEIELKSRELVSSSAIVLQKQEIISGLQQQLNKIKESSNEITDQVINELESKVRLNIDLDQEWERFKVHFEKVHHSFFQFLRSNSPNLTESDLRHCAYIKIGLTTKEIATLFNITPASVQKSRVRLKKKLNLSKSDDLYHFIKSDMS